MRKLTQRQRIAKSRVDLIASMERWAEAERRAWKTGSAKAKRDKEDAYSEFVADLWNYAIGARLGADGRVR